VKRVLICAGVAAALAMPTTTVAAVRHFHGAAHHRGAISFTARIWHGRVRRVAVGFAWKNLPVRCAEGHSDTDGRFTRSMRVHHRRFHGTGRTHTQAGWVIARVTGRFARHPRRARGTIRVHGDFGTRATSCDTDRERWRAHRVAA
jgi:hypothetical protein